MDVPQLKEHFWNPPLASLGLSELKPARAPMSCVWRGFFTWQSLNWNIISFGLKLCQWVQGPWHEWYWNSNESPTGGPFTWSCTLGPLNRGFFFFNYYYFLDTNVSVWSKLTHTTGIRWHKVSQCWNTSNLLVNGACLLCWGCFVEALFLCAHTVDINPSSFFSAHRLVLGVQISHINLVSALSAKTPCSEDWSHK